MSESNVVPIHIARQLQRQRELRGAYAVVEDEDGVTVVLQGMQLTMAKATAHDAATLVLALFSAQLSVSQIKDVAVALKGART